MGLVGFKSCDIKLLSVVADFFFASISVDSLALPCTYLRLHLHNTSGSTEKEPNVERIFFAVKNPPEA